MEWIQAQLEETASERRVGDRSNRVPRNLGCFDQGGDEGNGNDGTARTQRRCEV